MIAIPDGPAGGSSTQIAPLSLSTRSARLEKHTEQPSRLEINSTPASFEVDSTRARAEMGYESFTGFMRSERDRAFALAKQGAKRRVAEGRRLMNIAREPKAIKNLAREKSLPYRKRHEYGIGLKPRSTPDITWFVGGVEISYSPAVLGGTYTPGDVDIQV